MLADQIEREERMAQMVEHAHEDHEVELLADRGHIIDRQVGELDALEPEHLARQPRLGKVALVAVDAEHARRAAPLHLDRIETRVAADVEHALAAQIVRNDMGESLEFEARIIAEEMVGRCRHAVAEIDIVEPRAQRFDFFAQLDSIEYVCGLFCKLTQCSTSLLRQKLVPDDSLNGGHGNRISFRQRTAWHPVPTSINKASS
jgi:hypothetical protein